MLRPAAYSEANYFVPGSPLATSAAIYQTPVMAVARPPMAVSHVQQVVAPLAVSQTAYTPPMAPLHNITVPLNETPIHYTSHNWTW